MFFIPYDNWKIFFFKIDIVFAEVLFNRHVFPFFELIWNKSVFQFLSPQ